MSEFIPGNTYRDSVLVPGPSFLDKFKTHMLNWWGGWLFLSFVVTLVTLLVGSIVHQERMHDLANKHSLIFLDKQGIKNIKLINNWFGNFQVGSGCLGKDYAANMTAELDGKYLEVTTCCSPNGECKFLKYILEK